MFRLGSNAMKMRRQPNVKQKVRNHRSMTESHRRQLTKVFDVRQHCSIHCCDKRIRYPNRSHVNPYHNCRTSLPFVDTSTIKDGYNIAICASTSLAAFRCICLKRRKSSVESSSHRNRRFFCI